jgi:iron complex transport system substrate-binding protein
VAGDAEIFMGAHHVSLLAALLLAVSCTKQTSTGSEQRLRIISLVPSATELLFEVGARDQVVGVTTSCLYPPEAQEKEKIGGLIVDIEKVLSLRPDLILSSPIARKASGDLQRLGLRVVTIEANTFEEIAEQLRRVGGLTGHAQEGDVAADRLLARVRAVEARVGGLPPPTVFFETGGDPILTAGPRSYPGDALRRAGGQNIMYDLDRPWGTVSWEVVLKRDPEVILIAHASQALPARAGWEKLRAVQAGRVHHVPKEAFYYPTPRLAEGLELAARLFHGKD